MSKKLDFVNDYISNYVSDNFPELSRFKIEINPDNLYYQASINGYKQVLYIGLGHLTYPNEEIVNGGFHCWTQVTIVEDLLFDLIVKHGLHRQQLFPTIWFNEFTIKNFNEIWDSFRQFNGYDLSTDKEKLDALCQHYKEVIVQHFIPFWEKFSDIQYINNEIIDKVDQMNLANYFGVGLMSFKKLIIMRICRNQKYDTYKEWLLNTYKEEEDEMKNDTEWNAEYSLFKELIDILETK